ncbi:hypothetical protein SAMN04244572_00594 [Azotobacter beijerinckii]|uniref:Uncharacterized protein n=1 Tax=Azotobacter beijerinckii TaxID=170623 RepID=A0A1H6QLP1_9GAMM|nr:hypothetical protein [Azotobacter beijerinckii]MDV7212060.1 hypothetical protein [Azotobacter beijerinckii]SEI40225.1 hypothetical protein SAMN04244579_00252 [Azotobacter beijerinckii]SEI50516.1 hypothetical protein SAMN04244572_00594 [Azotobacter beijerinckii]
MFHLIPFAVGVVAGAVVLQLIRTDKTKAGLEKAQDKLRGATVSSLEAIEGASARARARLAGEAAPAAEAQAETPVGQEDQAGEQLPVVSEQAQGAAGAEERAP